MPAACKPWTRSATWPRSCRPWYSPGWTTRSPGLIALRAGAQDYLVKQRADGYDIARAVRFSVARKHLQLTADSQALHELDLTDDVIQQLYAIGLAMSTSRRRTVQKDPAMADRIAGHMNALQDVVQNIRDNTTSTGGSWSASSAPGGRP